MVLKIDHVSFSCGNETNWSDILTDDYTNSFIELNLVNIACKIPFLKYGSKTHNIIMCDAGASNIPIEITQYPEVHGYNNDIRIHGRYIEWNVKDVKKSAEFFKIVGFQVLEENESNILISLKTILDKNPIQIYLSESKEVSAEGFLDIFGYSSLAIIVDNLDKEIKKYKENGFYTTEISDLKVNGNMLSIAFVKGNCNEIIELIAFKI